MNKDQLLNILKEHAPKMPLCTAMEVVKEFETMRNALQERDYCILHSLKLLGYNDSGYPTKLIDNLSDNEKNALGIMIYIHGLYNCGIPGLKESLKNLEKQVPLDKYKSDMVTDSMNNLKNNLNG